MTCPTARPVEAPVPCAVRTALRRTDIQSRCPRSPDTLRGRRWSFACLHGRDRPGARRAACAGAWRIHGAAG